MSATARGKFLMTCPYLREIDIAIPPAVTAKHGTDSRRRSRRRDITGLPVTGTSLANARGRHHNPQRVPLAVLALARRKYVTAVQRKDGSLSGRCLDRIWLNLDIEVLPNPTLSDRSDTDYLKLFLLVSSPSSSLLAGGVHTRLVRRLRRQRTLLWQLVSNRFSTLDISLCISDGELF